MGLVNSVCETGSAVEAALCLADQICANGPIAVAASRRVVRLAGSAVDEPAVAVQEAGESYEELGVGEVQRPLSVEADN